MNKEFQSFSLSNDGALKAQVLAESFNELLEKLLILCPEPSREMSIARTHLETASFFAKKALAQLPENQEAK